MLMQISSRFITAVIRSILPRGLRNALRRPRTSWQRLRSKWERAKGKIIEVAILPEWKVRCHPICKEEFSVFQNDPEQKLELMCFARLATPGMQLIDVGTHWGVFTLAALNYGGPQARVIGIEASAEAVRIYRDNLEINQANDFVTVINAACGAQVGQLKMLTTGAGGADYLVVPAGDRPDTIVVPQVSVDSVVTEHGFKPSHLKIDVEGFEEEVLRGAEHTLRTERPVLFLELHGDLIRRRGMLPEAVLQALTEAGYTHWQQLDGTPLSFETLATMVFNARFVARHAGV